MSAFRSASFRVWLFCFAASLLFSSAVHADGKVFPPRNYKGSIEERSQEGIIIFHKSDKPGEAREDLILKISVEGPEAAESFGWVVPFPTEPKIAKEDAKLFKECFNYVEARRARSRKSEGTRGLFDGKAQKGAETESVEVLSRKIVGSYDTAVVRETKSGGLNDWLKKEGFTPLEKAEDVIGYYREKGYVFACMKVSETELGKEKSVDLHPLRFSFKTGGRDGIYFPMKMTSLQKEDFFVNLYVFYNKWINDHLSKFGYEHRGLKLKFRDWDSSKCTPNAGKAWSNPSRDPYLAAYASKIPTLKSLFQKLHPGERYYLTNMQGTFKPDHVREWTSDLWMFPYYTSKTFVPYDVRDDGPAAAAYPNVQTSFNESGPSSDGSDAGSSDSMSEHFLKPSYALALLAALVGGGLYWIRRRRFAAE